MEARLLAVVRTLDITRIDARVIRDIVRQRVHRLLREDQLRTLRRVDEFHARNVARELEDEALTITRGVRSSVRETSDRRDGRDGASGRAALGVDNKSQCKPFA